MSVADDLFNRAWGIVKAPVYHSVNTDTSDPEVAEKLWALRDELMAEGITFDAGGGYPKGGRDWELDWSLRGATPDEVMIRMRDAGIPFTSTMEYVDELGPEAEAFDHEKNMRDRRSDMGPVYQDAVGIGESKCPECGEMGMVIREPDESLTLACSDCGFMEEYQGGDFDEGVSKQFDQQRAGMARTVEQDQMPFEDEEVEVNLDGGGGEPDKCCLEALQLYQELTGDYTKSNPWIWSKGITTHDPPTDGFGEGELDCDELHSWLEWLVYDDPEAELMGDEAMAPKAKKVLEQWESCISGDFSGDFTASGDVFEDSWNIAKFGSNRCWLCEKVKNAYGRYPNLPYYPPNWGRPCECSGTLKSEKDEKPFHGYNPEKHSREGGLNAKGRAKAKKEEGANLKPPVTEKPSTLDPNSKKAKRRKSFCARMGGVKGPTSKEGKKTPKGAALDRWNC